MHFDPSIKGTISALKNVNCLSYSLMRSFPTRTNAEAVQSMRIRPSTTIMLQIRSEVRLQLIIPDTGVTGDW